MYTYDVPEAISQSVYFLILYYSCLSLSHYMYMGLILTVGIFTLPTS